jgi:hypothetical protein
MQACANIMMCPADDDGHCYWVGLVGEKFLEKMLHRMIHTMLEEVFGY